MSATAGTARVELWRAAILTFTSEQAYQNPFLDVEIWAVFTGPSGRVIRREAYWDGGLTWPEDYQILLDEDEGWGYTCLTMIDRETVGILYESSVAHMTFQAIRLDELIK